MPTMEELEQQYNQQATSPSMEELEAQYNQNRAASVAPQPMDNRQTPGFLKKVDMITTGVDRGVKNFTLALMSKLPFGDKWQQSIKNVDAQSTAEQEYNKKTYTGYYPQGGELAGEMLATAPVGGVLAKVGSKALSLGKGEAISPMLAKVTSKVPVVGELLSTPFAAGLPTGLKTVGKYGTSAVSGAGVLAGMESQRYNPDNPGELINTEAAGQALSNPLAYALPALGTKVSTWANASKELGKAKELLPSAMARNLKEPGASTTVSNMLFDLPASLLGRGKQLKDVGNDVSNFILGLAGSKQAQTADNLTEYSANIMRSTLKKMERAENKMWDAGFKTVPVTNAQQVKDEVVNAIDLLKTRKPSGYETSVADLQDALRTGNLTVNDVKQMQSIVSSASISARGLEGGVGNKLADQLKDIKDSLLDHIQGSLSPEAMKDFAAARAFSAEKFKLFSEAPMLEKAIYDNTVAHKLIGTLTSEGGVLPPKRAAISILSEKGRDMISATKLQQALEVSDPTKSGIIDLGIFLPKITEYTQNKTILNKDAYTALQGLHKYLLNINEASKVNRAGQTALGASLAGVAGLGALAGGPVGAAAALVSYGGALLVANHSPLKYALNALNKNLPSSTRDLLYKAVGRHLTRAGFFVSEDGVLKSEKD